MYYQQCKCPFGRYVQLIAIPFLWSHDSQRCQLRVYCDDAFQGKFWSASVLLMPRPATVARWFFPTILCLLLAVSTCLAVFCNMCLADERLDTEKDISVAISPRWIFSSILCDNVGRICRLSHVLAGRRCICEYFFGLFLVGTQELPPMLSNMSLSTFRIASSVCKNYFFFWIFSDRSSQTTNMQLVLGFLRTNTMFRWQSLGLGPEIISTDAFFNIASSSGVTGAQYK